MILAIIGSYKVPTVYPSSTPLSTRIQTVEGENRRGKNADDEDDDDEDVDEDDSDDDDDDDGGGGDGSTKAADVGGEVEGEV